MSDRKNRDKGIKTARKKYNRMCDCWYCMGGKDKKREMAEKQKRLFSDLSMVVIAINNK